MVNPPRVRTHRQNSSVLHHALAPVRQAERDAQRDADLRPPIDERLAAVLREALSVLEAGEPPDRQTSDVLEPLVHQLLAGLFVGDRRVAHQDEPEVPVLALHQVRELPHLLPGHPDPRCQTLLVAGLVRPSLQQVRPVTHRRQHRAGVALVPREGNLFRPAARWRWGRRRGLGGLRRRPRGRDGQGRRGRGARTAGVATEEPVGQAHKGDDSQNDRRVGDRCIPATSHTSPPGERQAPVCADGLVGAGCGAG